MCANGHRGATVSLSSTDEDWFWGTASSGLSSMFISKFTGDTLDYSLGEVYDTSNYTPNLMQWKDGFLIWTTSVTEGTNILFGEIDYSGGVNTLPPNGKRSMARPEAAMDIVAINAISTASIYLVAKILDTVL